MGWRQGTRNEARTISIRADGERRPAAADEGGEGPGEGLQVSCR
ncbi:hypothetical protein O5623_18795 [Escherichia coli]|nr:hypothetical protein [Escherichia coli]